LDILLISSAAQCFDDDADWLANEEGEQRRQEQGQEGRRRSTSRGCSDDQRS